MDSKNEQSNKISWLDKLFLKLWPNLEMRRMAKRMAVDNVMFNKLHEVFRGVKIIDIFPYSGNNRGFILALDRQTALFFNQDGGHFEYDGFEMGQYNKGEVTIFDNLTHKNLSPYPEEEKENENLL